MTIGWPLWGPIRAIARLSLRRFFRDKSNLFFMFVFPMALVVMIGLQFGGSSQPAVVIVGDGPLAQQLKDELREQVTVVEGHSAERARSLLARNRADAVVIISPETEAQFAADQPSPVEFLGGTSVRSAIAVPRVQAAVDAAGAHQANVTALGALGFSPSQARNAMDQTDAGPILLTETVGESELAEAFGDLDQFDLGASQQLSLFAFISTMSAASQFISARQLGVITRQLAAPVRPSTIVVGELAGRVVIALIQGLYIIVGTWLIFGVQWGDFSAVLLILALFSVVAAGAALVLGCSFSNEAAASGAAVGISLVLAGFGGSMLPLELMPQAMKNVAYFTPHRWAYVGYAEIMRNGGGITDVWESAVVLAGMGIVAVIVASFFLRRQLR